MRFWKVHKFERNFPVQDVTGKDDMSTHATTATTVTAAPETDHVAQSNELTKGTTELVQHFRL